MALVCPTDLTGVDIGFIEFIDCSSLSINYDVLGRATLNFTVVAAQAQPTGGAVGRAGRGQSNFSGRHHARLAAEGSRRVEMDQQRRRRDYNIRPCKDLRKHRWLMPAQRGYMRRAV